MQCNKFGVSSAENVKCENYFNSFWERYLHNSNQQTIIPSKLQTGSMTTDLLWIFSFKLQMVAVVPPSQLLAHNVTCGSLAKDWTCVQIFLCVPAWEGTFFSRKMKKNNNKHEHWQKEEGTTAKLTGPEWELLGSVPEVRKLHSMSHWYL